MHSRPLLVLLLTGVLAFATTATVASDERVWHGVVSIGDRPLDVRLTVASDSTGLKGRVDLVQARLQDFPLPTFAMQGDSLRFEVPPGWGLAMFRDIGLTPEQQRIAFAGTRSPDETITGTLTLSTTRLPLRLVRETKRVPASATYRAEDVQFTNGDVTLAGTLLLPRNPRGGTAVILVAGSGSHTRKAHALEAEALAQSGVAALVYDKRGAGRSVGANVGLATLEELATDVEAAVAYLRTRSEIQSDRIGLYGLSQGTWIGARVAARDPRLAFLVCVSGSGIPLWKQELYRVHAMMELYGYGRADIEAAEDFVRHKFRVGSSGLGWDELQGRMKQLKESNPKWYQEFADPPSSLLSARYWWTAFFGCDPKRDLARLKIPVLNLVGGRDRVVPPKDVMEAMRATLSQNPAHVFAELPAADHSMLAAARADGNNVCQLVMPEYLARLVTWVGERAAAKR